MIDKNNQILDASVSHSCSGFKYPNDCPIDGVYDADHKDCQECYQDAMKGIEDSTIELGYGNCPDCT